jgi:dihydrolipoamide dehydrogenase
LGRSPADFDASIGKLLAAHMIGAEATELIQGFVIAMNMETAEEELIHTVFPIPRSPHESVLDAHGRAIHE